MLAGLQDQVIPYSHTEKLWEASESRGKSKPKKSRWRWKGLRWKVAVDTSEASAEEEDAKPPILAKNNHRFFPGGSHSEFFQDHVQ